jgi:NAD(P)-dependent dehydrogenase (short-subunit alcohol dehydrogenase family)/acyl carrier protein
MEAIRLDVTRRADVEHLVASLTHTDKPLRGIVHAAVAYADALLPAMSADKVRNVLAPKIAGAINLTRAVEQASSRLDFFVTFSSLAQTIGWPGQSNYAAANGFLETLAHWHRGRGIKGQCISWGALGESGHVARRTGMQSYLESSGWIGMSNEVALTELGRALDLDLPAIAIAAADWSRLTGAHPAIARARRIGALIGSASGTAASGRALADLDADRLELAALDLVRTQTARVLRSQMADLTPETTLTGAGIDSLSSFELHNRIEQEAGLAIPMPRFVKARRVGELAALLASIVSEARSNVERK